MKSLFLSLFLFSANSVADCGVLLHDGGWFAEGLPGVVEVFFNLDMSVSIHMIGVDEPVEVEDHTASWVCLENSVKITMENSLVVGRVSKVSKKGNTIGGIWSIKFPYYKDGLLSNRVLYPFSF